MAKRKTLAAERRAKAKYRSKLFVEKMEEWHEMGRDKDKMPTLRVHIPGLEHILRRFQVTDEDHVYRTGERWPRPGEIRHEETEAIEQSSSLPHASNAKRFERIQQVTEEVIASVAYIKQISIDEWHKLKPVQQAALSRRGVFPQTLEELAEANKQPKPKVVLDLPLD
jgi:hypothetical protein